MKYRELLSGLFTSCKLMILDFGEIPEYSESEENLSVYFEDCKLNGVDPRTPKNRQLFNDRLIARSGYKYLLGRYGEDRRWTLEGSSIAKEGRTFHLGVDIFSQNLDSLYAPCDGTIIRTGNEPQAHSYGYYMVLQPDNSQLPYIFLGHLGSDMLGAGKVKAGDRIARLGDYVNNENGGWSRHLHLQMLKELPQEGETPIGYSTKANLDNNRSRFPDPMQYFPEWKIG